jgi:hypothetical protein
MSVTTFHDTNIIAILGMPGTTLPLPLPFYWRVLWKEGKEEKTTTVFFHMLNSSLFTDHPVVRRYTVRVIDRVVKQKNKDKTPSNSKLCLREERGFDTTD